MIEAVRRNDPLRCRICPSTVERQSRQQVSCSTRMSQTHMDGELTRLMHLKENRTTPMAATGRTPINKQAKTMFCNGQNSSRAFYCNGPLNLLGGGSWRWPGTVGLDSETLTKIGRREVGGELVYAVSQRGRADGGDRGSRRSAKG